MTEVQIKKPRGRPKGAKNKKTIIEEKAMDKAIDLASRRIANKIVNIVDTMCDKALKGDTTAAKLILDRCMPAMRSKDERSESNPSITINITASEVETNGITIDQENGSPDDAAESGTDRPQLAGPTSAHVVAIDGGAEG